MHYNHKSDILYIVSYKHLFFLDFQAGLLYSFKLDNCHAVNFHLVFGNEKANTFVKNGS